MIIVRLIGGLGNQLFQYSAGRALAERLGTDLVLDTTWFRGPFVANTPRVYGLASLNINARVASRSEERWFRFYSGRVLRRLPMPRPWNDVREGHFQYDPQIECVGDGSYLSGYWQSPRYFERVRGRLVQEIAPIARKPAGWDDALRRVRACEAVGVHVRRGDYVSHKRTAGVHGSLPVSYYTRGFELLRAQVQKPVALVFSDDLAWARANIQFDAVTEFVEPLSDDPIRELHLMRHCRHNIIANSSFSWWAAWLNESPGKVVIAPKDWFRGVRRDTSDLIPGDWVRI